MSPDTRMHLADTPDPVRDPARAAALHRLSGATAAASVPADPGATATASAPPVPTAHPVPWADADPDGRRPERVPPADPDPLAWADPPWWRRVRWAPDRVAGIALVVLVLALGAFSVHRLLSAVPVGPPVPDLPLATPGESVPAAGSTAPGASAVPVTGEPPSDQTAAEHLVVSVIGLVGRSGLVTVAPGARVADALDSAGGVLEGGDRDGLNLARKVVDGEQILVGLAPGPDGPRGPRSGIVGADPGPPVAGAPNAAAPNAAAPNAGAPAAAPGAPGAPAAGGGLVNLNSADAATLDTLPGVGPVTAAAILSWRAANGSFASVDQLAEVDGIGPATLARLRPLVMV
ncbi:helix-hairpin-helix domain-containing protein [Rhodococcus sp. IEGM 1408]|uniref:helix-hairpin-helix domain-containing protein n=1 Tax=Rhodococcus sp. IEGM 1408 TaxID=3082220 RepID=UPI002952A6A6|nr:helix-hairpin-helix domain-containing protein [Rhodococcus sp. IEGM 1408]MDV8000684.1 helix-hairpin-helix domain-containing protein [Rhodococcus sp. IEGM 1408]